MKRREHSAPAGIGAWSCVPFDLHLVAPPSYPIKICLSLATNKLKADDRLVTIVVVGTKLPFRQIRISPLSCRAVKRVSSVPMNMAKGLEPTMVLLVKVIPSGFHDALLGNFGWFKEIPEETINVFEEVFKKSCGVSTTVYGSTLWIELERVSYVFLLKILWCRRTFVFRKTIFCSDQ